MVNIREATVEDANGIAEVHVKSWQDAYHGIIAEDVLNNLSVERRQQYWHDILTNHSESNTVFVAEENNRIVGFISGGADRAETPEYDGELYAIYLLSETWRKGIGRDLVKAFASKMHESGFNQLLVWVLKDNPSRKFYEALGGSYVKENTINIGGDELMEIAYGWQDIRPLIAME